MMHIAELGHAGLHTQNLERMRDFYERVLGLAVTDEDPGLGLVFLSSRPQIEHHEFVLAKGRTAPTDARLLNQISWRVKDVAALQHYHWVFQEEAVRIQYVVTHGNAIGIYFQDPEGNQLEVYWTTGLHVAQPFRKAISLDGTPDEVIARNAQLVNEGGPRY